ncbi:MAG: hypothetical protein ABEK29_06750, partial [Bradymonadaceae bacterium]
MVGRLHFPIGLVALLVSLSIPIVGSAQSEAPPESPPRLVVLNVPGGGTDSLLSQLRAIDGVALQTQEWFVEQTKRQGLSPEGIMSDTKRLRMLLERAGIDYLLFLKPADSLYTATLLVGPDATATIEMEVDRSDGTLPKSSAEAIETRLTNFFDNESAETSSPSSADDTSESGDPALTKAPESQKADKSPSDA